MPTRKIRVVYEVDDRQLRRARQTIQAMGGDIEDLEEQIDDANESLRETPQELNQVQRSASGLGSQIKSLGKIFAGVFVAVKIKDFAKDSVNAFRTFESGLAKLSAITGATGKDLQFFEEAAREISATTTVSASDAVAAFELIGSAKPELLKSKEALKEVADAAIVLAEASGLELPTAADALTGALNQFGAPAEEASRFINVLAAGSKEGAAAIPLITDALLSFGSVAKSSNISIEESTALIELLAEKGLKGAEAGTALRNVLLKLSTAEALPKEAIQRLEAADVNINKLSNNAIPLSDRLDELGKIANDSTALVKVFGQENVVAAQNVLQNTGRLKELTTAVTGTNVAIEQQAIQTDTLDAKLAKLSNTVENVKISIGATLGGAIIEITEGFKSWDEVLKETGAISDVTSTKFRLLADEAGGMEAVINSLASVTGMSRDEIQRFTEQLDRTEFESLSLSEAYELLVERFKEFTANTVTATEVQDKFNKKARELLAIQDQQDKFNRKVNQSTQENTEKTKENEEAKKRAAAAAEKEAKENERLAKFIDDSRRAYVRILDARDAALRKQEENKKAIQDEKDELTDLIAEYNEAGDVIPSAVDKMNEKVKDLDVSPIDAESFDQILTSAQGLAGDLNQLAQQQTDTRIKQLEIERDARLQLAKGDLEAQAQIRADFDRRIENLQKTGAERQKSQAIALANINTFLAFTKTLASVPFPANLIAATSILVKGFAQVRAIEAQGFKEGGPVEGGKPNKDSVPAMLMPGEFVMKKAAVKKYGLPMMKAINEGDFSGLAPKIGIETAALQRELRGLRRDIKGQKQIVLNGDVLQKALADRIGKTTYINRKYSL